MSLIEVGQRYRRLTPSPGGSYRVVQVVAVPHCALAVEVCTVSPIGAALYHRRRLSVDLLHESPLTRTGAKRRTGYVLDAEYEYERLKGEAT